MAPTDLMQEFDTASPIVWGDIYSTGNQTELPGDLRHTMAVTNVRPDAGMKVPTLTKADLSELLFEQVGINKREAGDIVDLFFAEINNALERGESVKLSGFGNFQLRDKASRPGRNPKTGVEVNIPARRVVTFQPSQKLKTAAE